MPELPDLEIFAINLEKQFKNKTLEKVKVVVHKKLNVPEKELKEALEGHKLMQVSRVGKTLQLHFGGDNVLGLHLMLHGRLRPVGDEPVKYQLIQFVFAGGCAFALTDFQKQATPTLNPPENKVPDALSAEFDLDYFKTVSAKKQTTIKQVLMDQKIVRGIGNAYADEILWKARISPLSKANKIPESKLQELYKAISDLLKKEIKNLAKALPEVYDTEVRDFLVIHGAGIKKSPTGHEIKVETIDGRKAYYTDEQELFV
ncbi:formamidopyrimidine-DNA glycosylase [Pedobacter sp. MC2016-14]|uniref:Fpg/Nei family DNA glycosylase n=1 Tax=Pedobacter sp. MC2016-14 TaxID=2897327 RepID=UPI001E5243D0|nr:DNA-formamidopyrimidine glycosylase family protein [Pedobacter sp. MC2016-14]MCD0489682.1 formamidopyrimidine-DNA glycosylase [Pedobacter sp. MC2016-14]